MSSQACSWVCMGGNKPQPTVLKTCGLATCYPSKAVNHISLWRKCTNRREDWEDFLDCLENVHWHVLHRRLNHVKPLFCFFFFPALPYPYSFNSLFFHDSFRSHWGQFTLFHDAELVETKWTSRKHFHGWVGDSYALRPETDEKISVQSIHCSLYLFTVLWSLLTLIINWRNCRSFSGSYKF